MFPKAPETRFAPTAAGSPTAVGEKAAFTSSAGASVKDVMKVGEAASDGGNTKCAPDDLNSAPFLPEEDQRSFVTAQASDGLQAILSLSAADLEKTEPATRQYLVETVLAIGQQDSSLAEAASQAQAWLSGAGRRKTFGRGRGRLP